MVKINKSDLYSSLSYINNNAKTIKNEALVGQIENGSIRLWQPGFIKVWDSLRVDESDSMFYTVPCDKFSKIVNGCTSSTINMSVKDRKLHVNFGKSRVRIPLVESVEDKIEDPPEVVSTLRVGPDFIDALSKGLNFLAKTENQPILTCFSVSPLSSGILRIVASDAMKMFMADVEYDDAQTFSPFLLPREPALLFTKVLSKAKEISIGITERDILVVSEEGSERIVSTPPYQGKYPDLSFLADAEPKVIFKVPKKDLQDMLNLVDVTSDMKEIQFALVEGTVAVYASKAQIETDLFLEGAEVGNDFKKMSFFTDSFRSCVSAVNGNDVVVSMVNDKARAYSVDNGDRTEPYTFVQAISG